MPLGRFTLYSVLGTIPWCFGIAGAGWALGSSWETFHHDFRYVEVLVGVGDPRAPRVVSPAQAGD